MTKPTTATSTDTLSGAGDAAEVLGGWIALPRALQDEPVFGTAEMFHLFVYCLYEAAWKPRTVFMDTGRGKTRVDLEPGQLVFGRYAWGEKLKTSPETVRDRMKKLQQWGYIDIKPATHFSVVTICDWQRYRPRLGDSPPPNRHPTATQPPHSNNSNKSNKSNVEPPVADDLISAKPSSWADSPKKRRRERTKRTGIDAIDFSHCDFGTTQGISSAIDLLRAYGCISENYDATYRVVWAAMLTHKQKPKRPGAYFIKAFKTGSKFQPTPAQHDTIKAILQDIGF